MRQYLFFLGVFLLIKVGHSQTNVYHSFPDSNAFWNVHSQFCCYADCSPPPIPNPMFTDYYFSYFLNGDTIIDTNTYHKIYRSGSANEHCYYGSYDVWWYYNNEYVGAYRQDTVLKRVYYIGPMMPQGCLLYDFTLNIGDSLSGWCQNSYGIPTISSIDSVLIGNNYRKRFNFQSTPYSVIDGIGSTSGLLEPIIPSEGWGTLICFSQNGFTLFPDTVTSCDLATQINENQNDLSFSIFPNPFNDFTTIEMKSTLKNASLSVYNLFGQEVKKINNFSGNQIIFHKDNLPDGIYFIRLIQDNKILKTNKIIIN